MGEISPDLLLIGGNLVNVVTGEIIKADIAIKDNIIVRVGDCSDIIQKYGSQVKTVDCKDKYLLPGLIDTHLHTESTFLPPVQFGEVVLPHGTTTVVVDPHEITNVLGKKGLELYLEETKKSPLEFLVEIPSCVPSAPTLETSSNLLTADELRPVIQNKDYFALAEMMNFPGVIYRDQDVLKKLSYASEEGRILEGHSPGLRGKELQAYLTAGISSCHESFEVDEVIEKLRLGCFIQLREGSFAKNLVKLGKGIKKELVEAKSPWRNVIIASDDRHADDLINYGHLDHSLRLLVNEVELDPITAIQICTINPAMHLRRKDIGVIGPGKRANIVVVNDLNQFKVVDVINQGKHVAHDGDLIYKKLEHTDFPSWALRTVSPKYRPEEKDMIINGPAGIEEGKVEAHVIGALDHSLMTEHYIEKVPIEQGSVILPPEDDLTYFYLLDRYGLTDHFTKALCKGFQFTENGAIASTVCHDSHQLLLLGNDTKSLKTALDTVLRTNGGLVIVQNKNNNGSPIVETLPLPLAGIMSVDQPYSIAKKLARMKDISSQLCAGISEPFMALSFMALPVIPKLKITDKGLVDVEQFKVIDLFA